MQKMRNYRYHLMSIIRCEDQQLAMAQNQDNVINIQRRDHLVQKSGHDKNRNRHNNLCVDREKQGVSSRHRHIICNNKSNFLEPCFVKVLYYYS